MNDKPIPYPLRLPGLLPALLLLAALLWAFAGQWLISDPGSDGGSGIGGTGRLGSGVGGESGLGGTGGSYPGLGLVDPEQDEQGDSEQRLEALALRAPAARQLQSPVAVEGLRLASAPAGLTIAAPRRETLVRDSLLESVPRLPVETTPVPTPAGLAAVPGPERFGIVRDSLAEELLNTAESGLQDSLTTGRELLLAQAFETQHDEMPESSAEGSRQRLLLPVRPERPDRPAISGRRPSIDRNVPRPPVRPMQL